jgi:hypothetical protein
VGEIESKANSASFEHEAWAELGKNTFLCLGYLDSANLKIQDSLLVRESFSHIYWSFSHIYMGINE